MFCISASGDLSEQRHRTIHAVTTSDFEFLLLLNRLAWND